MAERFACLPKITNRKIFHYHFFLLPCRHKPHDKYVDKDHPGCFTEVRLGKSLRALLTKLELLPRLLFTDVYYCFMS